MTNSSGARTSRTWFNITVYPGEPGQWPAIVALVKNSWDPQRGTLPPDLLSREYVEHEHLVDAVLTCLNRTVALPPQQEKFPF